MYEHSNIDPYKNQSNKRTNIIKNNFAKSQCEKHSPYQSSGSYSQEEPYTERGDHSMTTEKILEIYIDKLNQDQLTFKEDMRESERRNSEKIDRIEAKFDKLQSGFDAKLDKMEQKIDNMHQELHTELTGMRGEVHGYKWQMWGMIITVILSMGGLIAAVVFGLPAWIQIAFS